MIGRCVSAQHGCQFGGGSAGRYALFQTCYDEEGKIGIVRSEIISSRHERLKHTVRKLLIWACTAAHFIYYGELKTARKNSNNRRGFALDLDDPVYNAGVSVKQVLPHNPADDNHIIPAYLRLFWQESATYYRRHTQYGKEVGRNVESLLDVWMIAAGRDSEGCILKQRCVLNTAGV